MTGKGPLRAGIVGTLVGVICCFSPLLVVVFGVVGLSSWLGWIDYALFPLMYVSMGIAAYGLYGHFGKVGADPRAIVSVIVVTVLGLVFWLEFRFAIRISITALIAIFGYAYFLRRRQKSEATAKGSGTGLRDTYD
ncbi:MAG: mercury resistance system transport protein MerF [Sneathiella sp.]